MLTTDEIINKKFDKSTFGSGYKPEEVDAFLSEIATEFEALCEEKAEAEEKLEILAEKLEEYRANEDSLRTVLIGAQKLGDSIIRDAKGKAEVIISDAEKNAKLTIIEADKQIKAEHDELIRIRKETSDFKKNLRAIYKQHLEMINAMPEADSPVSSIEEAPVAEENVANAEKEQISEEFAQVLDKVAMEETKEISFPTQE